MRVTKKAKNGKKSSLFTCFNTLRITGTDGVQGTFRIEYSLQITTHCQLQAVEACSPDQNDPFAFQVLWGECDQEHELVGGRDRPTLREHRHHEKADRQKYRQLEKTRNRQESQVLQTYQE